MWVCVKSDQRKYSIRNKMLKTYLLKAEAKLYSTFLFMRHSAKQGNYFQYCKILFSFLFQGAKVAIKHFQSFLCKNCSSWIAEPETWVQELHLLGNKSSLENLGPILWSQLYFCNVCNRIGSQGQANGSWAVQGWCYPLFLGFPRIVGEFSWETSNSEFPKLHFNDIFRNIEIWY